MNTPTRIHVPKEHDEIDNDFPCLKYGRSIGLKDDALRKKKKKRNHESSFLNSEQSTPREKTTSKMVETYEKTTNPKNTEISINYYNDL